MNSIFVVFDNEFSCFTSLPTQHHIAADFDPYEFLGCAQILIVFQGSMYV